MQMYATKWLIVNRIIRIRQKYVKPFNSEQKMSSGSFKHVIYKMFLEIFNMYVYRGFARGHWPNE